MRIRQVKDKAELCQKKLNGIKVSGNRLSDPLRKSALRQTSQNPNASPKWRWSTYPAIYTRIPDRTFNYSWSVVFCLIVWQWFWVKSVLKKNIFLHNESAPVSFENTNFRKIKISPDQFSSFFFHKIFI